MSNNENSVAIDKAAVSQAVSSPTKLESEASISPLEHSVKAKDTPSKGGDSRQTPPASGISSSASTSTRQQHLSADSKPNSNAQQQNRGSFQNGQARRYKNRSAGYNNGYSNRGVSRNFQGAQGAQQVPQSLLASAAAGNTAVPSLLTAPLLPIVPTPVTQQFLMPLPGDLLALSQYLSQQPLAPLGGQLPPLPALPPAAHLYYLQWRAFWADHFAQQQKAAAAAAAAGVVNSAPPTTAAPNPQPPSDAVPAAGTPPGELPFGVYHNGVMYFGETALKLAAQLAPLQMPNAGSAAVAAAAASTAGAPVAAAAASAAVNVPAPADAKSPPAAATGATPIPIANGALPTGSAVGEEALRLRHIREQIEYYFSEANLSRDAYLRSQMGANGWVPVDTLLRFRRLSQLRASPELVVKALAGSSLVEISSDALSMRCAHDPLKWVALAVAGSPLVAASSSGSASVSAHSPAAQSSGTAAVVAAASSAQAEAIVDTPSASAAASTAANPPVTPSEQIHNVPSSTATPTAIASNEMSVSSPPVPGSSVSIQSTSTSSSHDMATTTTTSPKSSSAESSSVPVPPVKEASESSTSATSASASSSKNADKSAASTAARAKSPPRATTSAATATEGRERTESNKSVQLNPEVPEFVPAYVHGESICFPGFDVEPSEVDSWSRVRTRHAHNPATSSSSSYAAGGGGRVSTRSRVVSESAADSGPSHGYSVLRSTGSRLAALDPSAAPSAGAKRPLVSSSTASAGGSSSQQQSDRPANLALRRLAAEAADEHVRSPGDSRRVRTFSSGMYGSV